MLAQGRNRHTGKAQPGGARALIIHPASTTDRQLGEARQVASGAGPKAVRLSIGIETIDDLIRDLDQALGTQG